MRLQVIILNASSLGLTLEFHSPLALTCGIYWDIQDICLLVVNRSIFYGRYWFTWLKVLRGCIARFVELRETQFVDGASCL